jgi:hypothetical protein
MFCGSARLTVLLLAVISCAGCATTKAQSINVFDLTQDPQSHKNERVQVTDYVAAYEPARGDTYRTLSFALGSQPGTHIAVSCAGYNAEAIAKASALVGKAFENHGRITVTGKAKVDSKTEPALSELRLESVEYGGRKINVSRGRRTRPGFGVGGWYFSPSIAVGATITP